MNYLLSCTETTEHCYRKMYIRYEAHSNTQKFMDERHKSAKTKWMSLEANIRSPVCHQTSKNSLRQSSSKKRSKLHYHENSVS